MSPNGNLVEWTGGRKPSGINKTLEAVADELLPRGATGGTQ